MSGESSFCGIELGRVLAGKAHAPVVYFVRVGGNVKIGTTTNLKGRMQDFYLSLEDVLVIVPGGEDVEAAYHERFAENRVDGPRRELFHVDQHLRAFLNPVRPGELARPTSPAAEGEPAQTAGVTLAEAVEAGMFGRRNLAAVRKQLQRDLRAPSPIVRGYAGGPAHRYDEDALRAFAAREMGVTPRD